MRNQMVAAQRDLVETTLDQRTSPKDPQCESPHLDRRKCGITGTEARNLQPSNRAKCRLHRVGERGVECQVESAIDNRTSLIIPAFADSFDDNYWQVLVTLALPTEARIPPERREHGHPTVADARQFGAARYLSVRRVIKHRRVVSEPALEVCRSDRRVPLATNDASRRGDSGPPEQSHPVSARQGPEPAWQIRCSPERFGASTHRVSVSASSQSGSGQRNIKSGSIATACSLPPHWRGCAPESAHATFRA